MRNIDRVRLGASLGCTCVLVYCSALTGSALADSSRLPAPIVADSRTISATTVIDGHLVTFEALTPREARLIPKGVVRASIDGQPAHWYAFIKGPIKPGQLASQRLVAFDPSEANGNYPGVVSVSVVGNNTGNLLLTGTASAPILDLNTTITLSGATAITLSNTSGATISSAGTGGTNAGLTFATSGTPGGDAYVFSVNNNPAGNLINVKNSTGTVATVDANGALTAKAVVFAAPLATPTASAVWCQNDNAATNGLTCNIPQSSTNGYRLRVSNNLRFQVTTTGIASAAVDGTQNVPLTGVFTGGAAAGSTAYGEYEHAQFTDASTCANATVCGSATVNVKSPANATACGASNGAINSKVIPFLSGSGGGSYTVYWYNVSGGTVAANTTYYADVLCIGY